MFQYILTLRLKETFKNFLLEKFLQNLKNLSFFFLKKFIFISFQLGLGKYQILKKLNFISYFESNFELKFGYHFGINFVKNVQTRFQNVCLLYIFKFFVFLNFLCFLILYELNIIFIQEQRMIVFDKIY